MNKREIPITATFQRLVVTSLLQSMCLATLCASFHMPMIQHRPTTLLHSFSLTSALESYSRNDNETSVIQWIDVASPPNNEGNHLEDECHSLPLYPLSACYLPIGQHQLRNIEPRNLKMALDLGVGGRFCVALSAQDTGRIASVGTVFRILHMDTQNDPASGKLARILLTCQAEELVNIQRINNPEVALWENRLKRSDQYLVATVCPRPDAWWNSNSNHAQPIYKTILEDYDIVSHMYQTGVGTDDLPPFSRKRLEDLLPLRSLNDTSMDDSSSFWQMTQDWQTLCYTVREGRQIALGSDRNELLIDAAMRKGGPLNLPVHVEDLLLEDRQKVQDLEVNAQQQWLSLQLDPTIEFQLLLSFNTHQERLEYFASMIHRERKRLETIIQQTGSQAKIDLDKKTVIKPQKGAWFDDSFWS